MHAINFAAETATQNTPVAAVQQPQAVHKALREPVELLTRDELNSIGGGSIIYIMD